MITVSQLLDGKGHEVWTISPESSVYDAISLMAEREVGALPVVEGQALVGIVSERDYARKVILKGRSSRDTPVNEIMSDKVFYARPDQTVEQCMALMTERRIRHLPVLEGDQLIGVLSIGDLVKSILADREFLIQQLEQYITGR